MTIKAFALAATVLALTACSPSGNDPHTAAQTPRPATPDARSTADTPRAPEPPPAPKVDTSGPTATDAPATQPLSTLEKREEQNSMPMAGHGNNHSSPALEPKKDPGKS